MIRRFNRFELKYVISTRDQPALLDDIQKQMAPDAHGGVAGYRVTSLYYDSPDLCCYWSKREGIRYRRKVRIRTYGASASADDPVMVEIKQRIDRTVQKRRVRMPLTSAYGLCEGSAPVEPADDLDRAVCMEVDLLVKSLHLRPSCVVSYLRTAWVGGPYEPGLRLTFDSDLSCRGSENGLGPSVHRHYFMPADRMVLEIKVDEKVPIWVTRMVSRHGLQLRRMSKYCESVARLRGLERGVLTSESEPWTS